MSYLFGAGRPQPTSAEKLAAAETEVEMVSDMLNRYLPLLQQAPNHSDFLFYPPPAISTNISPSSLIQSCTKKCIPPDYREPDLNKGESVCLDRCVSKFFDVNMKVSEKMQGEAAMKQGGGGGGMGFGM